MEYLGFNIHKGEAETISLAEELSADLLLLDDYWARKFAEYRRFKITGTLGILIKAKKQGLISLIKTYMDKLIASNFRISDELYNHALKIAGE